MLKIKDYTFFSAHRGTFSKIKHIIGHKTGLNTYKKIEIILCIIVIKNNDFMKFIGKLMELENIILGEVTHSQKNTHGIHSLISGY